MSKPSLVLIGGGGHAQACIDVIEQEGKFQIVGLVDRIEKFGSEQLGYRVIAADHSLLQLARDHRHALVVIGQIKSPEQRIRLFEAARAAGFEFPSIISPHAYVSRHAEIGAGSIVMHGAIVNAAAEVGRNCIVNSRALIEHGATVQDHCHVATGATLNGDVCVGTGSFIGSGSTVKEGVSLGERCFVGMGLCVRHDHADGAFVIK